MYSYDRRQPIVLTVEGSRYDIGLQVGKALAPMIAADAKEIASEVTERQWAWLKKAMEITEQSFPDAMSEMRGLCAGSGAKLEHVFASLTEEIDEFSDGCTDIAAAGSATINGHTIIGHTNDAYDQSILPLVLIRSIVPGNPNLLGFALRGHGYSCGFNGAGLAFIGTHLTQDDVKEGVPRLILFGEMMRASTAEEAFAIAAHPMRASSYSYMVASADRVWSLEGSADHMVRLRVQPPGGVVAHANHYITRLLHDKVEAKPPKEMKDSLIRQIQAEKLLHERMGQLSPETMCDIVCDHATTPHSICDHGVNGMGETVFGLVSDVTDRTVWVGVGQPCQANWVKHRF